jgi:alkylation response protein AidB-like acyl-CoA dehydrogenase
MGIIVTLALLAALAAGAGMGILLTVGHYARARAQQQADEQKLAEFQELYAVWAALRNKGQRPDK